MTPTRTIRRATVVVLTALMASAMAAGPALAAPKNATGTKSTTDAEATTPQSEVSTEDLRTLEATNTTLAATSGSLFDVATRIRLIDAAGTTLVPYTGKGVTIAMIDTGVVPVDGLAHSNVVVGPDFSFEDQYPALRGLDTNGHGTHMAGIMVATDESWGAGDRQRRPDRVLGIAPDATLLSIKAGSADGGVDVTQIIAAINWVTAQKRSGAIDIDVLNLSFSVDSEGLYTTDPLAHAVERAWDTGIVVVVAAGNEGPDWQLQNPARDPFVIAVGASELEGEREASADFSSTGLFRRPDVRAPGRSIISLRVVGAWYEQYNEAGRVGSALVRGSGTSQAAAVVSGAAALLLQARPDLSPDEVKAILSQATKKSSTTDFDWLDLALVDLDLSIAIDAKPLKDATQVHYRSTGRGSIDSTRGGVALVGIDGVGLTGDRDIFGNDWSPARWSVDSWSDNAWSGGSWTGGSWAGGSWATDMWTGDSWAGGSWAGGSWAGGSWAGGSWAGGSWAGGSWAGGSWAGGSWAGGSWAGGSWAGGSWAGEGWN